jgi:hypothetical protein
MATYYVANAGSNSNNGTSSSTPFQTLAHAESVASQGDTINLNGGDTFSENVSFTVGVTLQSYGTGQGTIAGGTSPAVTFGSVGNWTINNLALTNSYVTDPGGTPPGVVQWEPTGSATFSNVAITNCTISGGLQGIRIVAGSTTTLLQGLTISGNTITNCILTGLIAGASGATAGTNYCTSNMLVTNNTFSNLPGDTSRGGGDGIVLQFVNVLAGPSVISSNTFHDLGAGCGASEGGGGTAIQLEGCTGVAIGPSNVFYNCFCTDVSADGGEAIDIDHACNSCSAFYNYGYDIDGAFLAGYSGTGFSGNVFYGNIGVNVARVDSGGIRLDLGSPDTGSGGYTFYNNTIICNNANPAVFVISGCQASKTLLNNAFITPAGVPTVQLANSTLTGLVMDGNYHQSGPGLFLVNDGTAYTTLAAWKTASSLEPSGIAAGSCYFPQSQPPAVLTPTTLNGAWAYSPVAGSPLTNAGANLSGTYAITPPVDFLGNAWSQNSIGAIYSVSAPNGYVATVLADNPIVFLRLAEPSGSSAADSLPGVELLTWTSPTLGGSVLIPGDRGTSVSFNGSSTYAQVGNSPAIPHTFSLSAVSFEAWFSTGTIASADQALLYSIDNGISVTVLNLSIADAGMLIVLRDVSSNTLHATFATGLAINTTYHMVLTWAGSNTVALYINGVSQAPTYVTQQTPAAWPMTNLFVGASSTPNSFFQGLMAGVAIYPTALSQARVTAHYEAGIATPLIFASTRFDGGFDTAYEGGMGQ